MLTRIEELVNTAYTLQRTQNIEKGQSLMDALKATDTRAYARIEGTAADCSIKGNLVEEFFKALVAIWVYN